MPSRWAKQMSGLFWLTIALVAAGQARVVAPNDATPAPQMAVHQTADGFEAEVGNETVRVTVCTDSVIHVVAFPSDASAAGASPAQPWMLDRSAACPGAGFTFTRDAAAPSLTTATLRVKIQSPGGNLAFSSTDGVDLLKEFARIPRTYEPVEVDGTSAFHTEDRFSPGMTEGLYGLGQHQNGMFNYRGATVELAQNNTDVAVPLLLSSKGYGLLWNTASQTTFDNRYAQVFSFTSAAALAVDYYFIYGPDFDRIIHRYRQMTGHAPMLPAWAYGFFQSKDTYASQAEILDVARRYRSEHIPLDCIVQDGGWWKVKGDPVFRPAYPDVPAELKKLHDAHVHTLLSVWGGYKDGSVNLETMKTNGWLIPGTEQYDATNPAARDFFFDSLPGPLLAQGWDAFWLDASEPDFGPHEGDALLLGKKLAIGSGTMYTNIYPLLHTGGIADHWRHATDGKRVLLLTRSAFLGEQRNGTIVWSGDVYPTNWALRRQIAAGLNFAVSGMPYWTTDVAGYFPYDQSVSMTSPEYQELYLRWSEFGVFCPIFRTHGHRPHNEIWTYDRVEPALKEYDRLRYRMLPYIYSLAWKVTHEDYTMQRPLIMDWRTDPNVADIGDEYMFGPAFLVSPVWKQGATKRDVYLPAAPAWYDFWSGEKIAGSQELEANAPLDRIPLFLRAGSIVPLGPEIEYAGERPAGPIELRVYRGADGSFDLYQDQGDGYDYEHGAYSVIPIQWHDASATLTLGERVGSFRGEPEHITFRVVLVSRGHGDGESVSTDANAVADYVGRKIELKLASK